MKHTLATSFQTAFTRPSWCWRGWLLAQLKDPNYVAKRSLDVKFSCWLDPEPPAHALMEENPKTCGWGAVKDKWPLKTCPWQLTNTLNRLRSFTLLLMVVVPWKLVPEKIRPHCTTYVENPSNYKICIGNTPKYTLIEAVSKYPKLSLTITVKDRLLIHDSDIGLLPMAATKYLCWTLLCKKLL